MRKIVFKDEGVRLEDGGFISNLENGSDALDIVGEVASVDIGSFAADSASFNGDFALLEKVIIGAGDIINRLI